MRTDIGFGAFISYSGHEDRALISKLQNGIEKLAKKWYEPPVMKVFVDKTSIAAGTRLWGRIESGLSRSRWLILFASPEAAQSFWVNREVQWWLAQRPIDNLIIVHTAGRLSWDRQLRDFAADSDALPPCLRGAFAEEPVWVSVPRNDPGADLEKAVLNVTSAVREVPIHELSSQAYREHRRTIRWATGAIAALSLLLVAALVLSFVAFTQKRHADQQARIALARQLAATSIASLSSNPRAAMMLAASGFHIDPSSQTFTALMRADTANPKLVRYVGVDQPVSALQGSRGGHVVVAGLLDGSVTRWNVAEQEPHRVIKLPQKVTSVATNSDGSVVVASDGTVASLWRSGGDPVGLPIREHQKVSAVTVSPSGLTVALHAYDEAGGEQSNLVFKGSKAESLKFHRDEGSDATTSDLVAANDDELLRFREEDGSWDRRRIADWSVVESGTVRIGARQLAAAPSDNGVFLTSTDGSTMIPVWRAHGVTDPDHPGLTAHVPMNSANSAGALALSPDGSRLALAGSGSIYVAAVAPESGALVREPTVELPAAGTVPEGELRFLGDNRHLVSASGNHIALWDLDQVDRLAHVATTDLDTDPCNACTGTPLLVSPDGAKVVLANQMGPWGIFPMPGREGRPEPLPGATGLPLWDNDNQLIVLADPSSDFHGASGVRALSFGDGDPFTAAALTADGSSVVAVDLTGQIFVVDRSSGAVRQTIPGPHLSNGDQVSAAINSSATLVARVAKGVVRVFDVHEGRDVGSIPGDDITEVAFAASRLLVQRAPGNLEVWDERGSALVRVILGDNGHVQPPIADSRGRIAARLNDGYGIDLFDLETGTLVNTIPPRPGSVRTNYAFAPAGLTLVTTTDYSSGDGGAEFASRDLSAPALLAAACTAAGGNLSADEWVSLAGVDDPGTAGCS